MGKTNPELEVTAVVVLTLAIVHVQTLLEKSLGSSVKYSVVREGRIDEIDEGHSLKARECFGRRDET